MANRVPLVIDASTLYLKELPANDNLDLTGSGIHNAGVITATSFSGDGSGLTGVASTDNILTGTAATFTSGITVVGSAVTIHNAGVHISGVTTSISLVAGSAQISDLTNNRVVIAGANGELEDSSNLTFDGSTLGVTGAVTATSSVVGSAVTTHNKGIDVAGIVTATGGFSGPLTGDVTGNATGLSGTPNITVGNITAADITASGTVQYEDVVSVDSAGIGTFKGGIDVVGAAVTIHNEGVHVTGVVTATSFVGDGSGLSGVISGTELKQAGTSVGTGVTQINFASGATLTTASLGISTITIAAGITTAEQTGATGVITINLDNAQHHDIYLAAGISTVTCTGGTAGDSHSVIFTHPSAAGVTTVGFSTYFLFPSGSVPVLSGGSNKVDLVSFVLKRQGTAGIGTQLLASAGLDYQ